MLEQVTARVLLIPSVMTLEETYSRFMGQGGLRLFGIAAAVVVLGWLAFSAVEARNIRVDRRTITDARIPASLDGTTLVFAADIHAGPLFGAAQTRSLVERINAESPDVVVLGGDYVGGRANGAKRFYPEIGGLETSRGTFAVLGNHDSWEGEASARTGLESAGIRLLDNDVVHLGEADDTIAIAGLADEWTGRPDPFGAAEELADDEFAVLVAHNPDTLAYSLGVEENPWALALAGHTHGGQVRGVYQLLPHKPSQYGKRFLTGWSDENGTDVLVTNGVGMVTLPLRFFAPPQIHVITLRSS